MIRTDYRLRFEIEKLEHAANLFKAVVHPTRLSVIDLLDQNNEMNVTDIVNVLDISQALMSHHLNDMKNKGILKSRREGQQIYYSINQKAVIGILKCIQNCK